jgi:hypothetical protein
VAEQQHRLGPGCIVASGEIAAEQRLDAEDREEIMRDDADVDAIGRAAARLDWRRCSVKPIWLWISTNVPSR